MPKPDTWSGDTLHVRYDADAKIVLDWAPTVETRIKLLLGGHRDSLIVIFHAVEHAAQPHPGHDPPAILDATLDRVLVLRRP